MARPPNTDERRAQIATALLKVMAHHGYDGASIADIARAARIAPGAVHYHYRDKQEILLAALELLVREHSQRLMIALDAVGADPAAQLATFIDVHLGLGAHADPDALACWVLLAGEALRQRAVGTRFEAALVAIAHTLAEIIARGIATRAFRCDDPHAVAAALVATIQGYFVVAATARSLVPRGTAGACRPHGRGTARRDGADRVRACRRPRARRRTHVTIAQRRTGRACARCPDSACADLPRASRALVTTRPDAIGRAADRATLARLGLLGSLYFAQGLPFGFFTQALPLLLRDRDYSLTAVGLSSLLAIPWALKFLWAPVVERHWWPRIGRRRSWILAMQLAATVALLALAVVPGGTDSMPVLMTAVFALNLIAATQDIATDGLAVEMLGPDERGFANGLQVAGYRVGMIVGGGVLLILHEQLGARGTFLAMAALTALASVPVLRATEPPTIARVATATPAPHFLHRPGAWHVVALLAIYKAGEAFATGMLRPYLHDLRGSRSATSAGCSARSASSPACWARWRAARWSTGWGGSGRCSVSAPPRPRRSLATRCSRSARPIGARCTRCAASSTSPAAWRPRRCSPA